MVKISYGVLVLWIAGAAACSSGDGASSPHGGTGGGGVGAGGGGGAGAGHAAGGGGGDGGGGGGGGSSAPLLVLGADGSPEPADFSCLGIETVAPPGPPVELTLPVVAFGQADPDGNPILVSDMEVQVFEGNAIPLGSSCGAGCELATDLGGGLYRIEVPEDAWFAYRVLERPAQGAFPALLRTMEVNVAPDLQVNGWLNTVAEPLLDGLYALLMVERDPRRALVAGRLTDCQGRFVSGARLRLFTDAGDEIFPDAETLVVYFDETGMLPDPNQPNTHWDGRFAIANVTAGAGGVRIEAWGVVPDTQTEAMIACELAPTAADAMTNLRLVPLRADGPSGCSRP